MDLKISDVQKMIDNSREKRDIEELRVAREELLRKKRVEAMKAKKEARVKKQTRRLAISAGLVLTAGVAIGNCAKKGFERYEGKSEIVSEFYDATSGYGVVNNSDGYTINKGDSYLEFDTAISSMVDDAKVKGMSDQEIAIGLADAFNKNVAEDAMGEYPSFSERNQMYDKAYHEAKVEEINKGVSK